MTETTLHFPFAAPPAGVATLAVAPGIQWLRMPLPFALDHINLWLVDDGDALAIVDTGLGDAASRATWDAVLAQAGRSVSKIIVTHYHPDHVGNAQYLAERTGAPIWMSTGEYLLAHTLLAGIGGYDIASMVEHFRRHGLDAARCDKLSQRGNVYARGVPALPMHYRRLADGDELFIGGHAWRMIVGYGHSPEHMALYCADLHVLISGDMLLPRITTNVNVPPALPEEDSVSRFLDSVRRFAPLPADTLVLPSHGAPFQGVQARIGQLDAHHAERDATLLAALDVPRTAAEVLPVLFARELDSHQVMFAMGEAIAHLNQLHARGSVQRSVEDGLIRFRAAG
ncbi:MAG: MBL fold metallo-hydrolase [Rhodocyclaceae bacterium]